MTSGNGSSDRVTRSPEPIPLRDLRPPDGGDDESSTNSPPSNTGHNTNWGHLGREGLQWQAVPPVSSGSGVVASEVEGHRRGRGGGEIEGGEGGEEGGSSSSGGGGGFGSGFGGSSQQASLSPNAVQLGGGLRPGGFGEIGRRLSTSLHLQGAQNPFSKAGFENKLGGTDEGGRSLRASGYTPDVKVTILDVDDDEDDKDIPPPTAFRDGLLDALGVSEGGALTASGVRRGSWLPGAEAVVGRSRRGSWLSGGGVDDIPPWAVGPDYDSRPLSIVEANEDDDAPLTAASNMQPMAGSNLIPEGGAGSSYLSPPAFSGPFGGGSSGGRIGDDLSNVEQGIGRSMSVSRRKSLSPATAGAFGRRLSTAVGMMSQRVVNLGNDPGAVENSLRRKSSTKGREVLPPPTSPFLGIPELPTDIPLDDVTLEKPDSPSRKHHLPQPEHIPHHPHKPRPENLWRQEQMNPLKGVSLRIFGPDNWLRVRLCSILVHP